MTDTPTPLDPIAQPVAKNQSDGHRPIASQPQPVSQLQQKKGWTGFAEKTLWDWLNLLGVFLIPIVIAAASIWFSVQQSITSLQLSDKQHQSDQTIASDQQRATILTTYMDDMTELLLHEGLQESQAGASVRAIARAKTLVALSQLDNPRKKTVVQFLYEARLIGYINYPDMGTHINSIIDLMAANLSNVDLSNVDLTHVDPGHSDLTGIDLGGADLNKANLSKADLNGANLSKANLSKADLNWAYLNDADLSYADLTRAHLSEVGLNTDNLSYADLNGADLSNAYLGGADLNWAHLNGANLSNADLSNADLNGANLSNADLTGAKVTPDELAMAYRLKDATLPDGSLYPSTSYPIPNHQEPTN